MSKKDYITLKEFFGEIGFSRRTAMTWLKEHKIKSIKFKGKHYFHKSLMPKFAFPKD